TRRSSDLWEEVQNKNTTKNEGCLQVEPNCTYECIYNFQSLRQPSNCYFILTYQGMEECLARLLLQAQLISFSTPQLHVPTVHRYPNILDGGHHRHRYRDKFLHLE